MRIDVILHQYFEQNYSWLLMGLKYGKICYAGYWFPTAEYFRECGSTKAVPSRRQIYWPRLTEWRMWSEVTKVVVPLTAASIKHNRKISIKARTQCTCSICNKIEEHKPRTCTTLKKYEHVDVLAGSYTYSKCCCALLLY